MHANVLYNIGLSDDYQYNFTPKSIPEWRPRRPYLLLDLAGIRWVQPDSTFQPCLWVHRVCVLVCFLKNLLTLRKLVIPCASKDCNVLEIESFLFDNLKSNHKGEHQLSSAALQLQLIQHGLWWFWQSRFLGRVTRMESQCPLMVSTCSPLRFDGTMNTCQVMASCFTQHGERTEDWALPSTANRSCVPFSPPYSRMLFHRLWHTFGSQLHIGNWRC